jgi:hypothetical protein
VISKNYPQKFYKVNLAGEEKRTKGTGESPENNDVGMSERGKNVYTGSLA